uniref:EGF-like domain-containing protein n=1 Tax=Eptatretus burgeri TaxID=7764 RepID=A0A8C4Q2U0_EPTBU
ASTRHACYIFLHHNAPHKVTPEELLKHFQCNTTEPANKLCVPQAGGASCECEQGNTAVNLTCDIDECAGNKHNCNENAICENTKASFTCSCKQGYTDEELKQNTAIVEGGCMSGIPTKNMYKSKFTSCKGIQLLR